MSEPIESPKPQIEAKCKNCVAWSRHRRLPDYFGECDRVNDNGHWIYRDQAEIAFTAGREGSVLRTMPDFGCILFTTTYPKPTNPDDEDDYSTDLTDLT